MTTDNIFSGLKVVDLASFIAGPGAAVILSHNYHNDLRFLRALLPSPVGYLGVLGLTL